ncbi:helix-turn-helix transcriptional regulator [Halomarina salina]|uniref:Helix-turn-helix transcriptional regulator n=1 Tax=Halomarina salina TaxID=1872699 RepID=A0ABD5RKU7_9EURY|nr:helix-turn-helix transcriptional regulator [Halomarina salina]
MSSETELNWTTLSGFERDVLQAAAALEAEEGATTGVALRQALERAGYDAVSHGRVYQNVNRLRQRGAMERVPVDGRSYHYRPTERGRRVARDHLDAVATVFGEA